MEHSARDQEYLTPWFGGRSSTRQKPGSRAYSGRAILLANAGELRDRSDQTQGLADPPREASAKRMPPICLTRTPYHRESQAL